MILKRKQLYIVNKKASYEYDLLEKYVAGIVLTGTEIKSIRKGKVSIREAFCGFEKDSDELFVINMTIEAYDYGNHYNHLPKQRRKLLLQTQELKKIHKKVLTTGITIVPTKLFINERGWAKMEIALAKGKKLFDKRESIRDRENKIKIDRVIKKYKY